jgi:hypothetical protein
MEKQPLENSQHTSAFVLAPADCLLGMLQRGRGKAVLISRRKPPEEVWPLLVECITHDPCLDKQCENRQEYYADIAHQTRMPCEPLRQHLKEYDSDQEEYNWKTSLTLSTLECLAERGCAESVQILREYISYGVDWIWALEVLAELYPSGESRDIDALLCKRCAQDPHAIGELQSGMRERSEWYSEYLHDEPDLRLLLPFCEPWKTFCAQNRDVAGIFKEQGFPADMDIPVAPAKEIHPEPTDFSIEELFQWVDNITYWKLRDALVSKVSLDDESLLLANLSHPNKWGVAPGPARNTGQFKVTKGKLS